MSSAATKDPGNIISRVPKRQKYLRQDVGRHSSNCVSLSALARDRHGWVHL
jgi:hypothetical protein